jgi:3-phosphoshikimate 1-carboxyvinyltransferase
LAAGICSISGFLQAEDCLRTIACMQGLGVRIERQGSELEVHGVGLHGLQEPETVLDAGNSGTTMRLLAGVLAGQPFFSTLAGDSSLCRRPMKRITQPLSAMGATILGRKQGELAPLAISGGQLSPLVHRLDTASAQVKSAILLAGLFTGGWTEVIEPARSRNHTELMLDNFGVPVEIDGQSIRVRGGSNLTAQDIQVPGDISSAAFWMVAATLVSNAELVIENVGLNPTRTGIINVLNAMGAKITILRSWFSAGELLGDIKVASSSLSAICIGGDTIVNLIDEVPILAVAATAAAGITEIRDATELKVKESNRLHAMVQELTKLGAKIEELPDGLRIHGGHILRGNTCDSHGDHRIAMSLAVAGLIAQGQTCITNADVVSISYPDFFSKLRLLANQK